MKKIILLFIVSIKILFAQVNTESLRKDFDSLGFAGNVGVDFTSLTGNTELLLFSFNGRLNYNFGKSYSFFVFNTDLGFKDKERFSNLSVFHLRFVTSITEVLQIESFAQYNYDKSRLLLNRELLGAGNRIKLLTQDNLKIRLGISAMMEFEEYDLPDNSIHPKSVKDFRLSTYLSLSFTINDNSNFISTSYYQPLPKDFADAKLLTENSLETKIKDELKVLIKFNARFDSRPPDGRKKLDTTTKVGLVYEF